ncbi:MAG: hypothetical protein ACTSYI_16570 [Promethearchaeota archaeon]
MGLFQIESLSSILSLSFEIVIAFLCLEFFLLFFERYSHKKGGQPSNSSSNKPESKTKSNTLYNYLRIMQNRELSWGIMFFLFSLMMILHVSGDFYTERPEIKLIFKYAQNLAYIFALTLFTYSLENSELHLNHYTLSKILGVLSLGTMLIMIFWPDITEVVLYLTILPVFVVLVQYGWITFQHTKDLRAFRHPFFALFYGLGLFIGGYFLTRMFFDARDFPGIGISGRLIGDIIQLVGISSCAVAFFFLPSLDELNWVAKIQQLFVIYPNGLSLFSYNFDQGQLSSHTSSSSSPSHSPSHSPSPSLESDLTTSVIVSINTLAQEVSHRQKSSIRVIRKENFTILLEFGDQCICALITSEEGLIIKKKIHQFCQAFEKQYAPMLERWSGNTSQFDSAQKIVKEVFRIED